MKTSVERIITRTSLFGAAVGVVLSPIPLADEVVLLPTFALMTARIAREHGLSLARVPWSDAAVRGFAVLAARAAANLPFSAIPVVAAVVTAASAVAATRHFGGYVDGVCAAAASPSSDATPDETAPAGAT